MKQVEMTNAIAPANRKSTRADAVPSRKAKKEWSVELKLRLPHKIGQPLGSGAGSDGGA